MRPAKLLLAVTLVVACAAAVQGQDDVYAHIKPLESAIASGTATRAQQLELARLYVDSGRFYEASKLANDLLASDANDADAVAVRDRATKELHDQAEKNV